MRRLVAALSLAAACAGPGPVSEPPPPRTPVLAVPGVVSRRALAVRGLAPAGTEVRVYASVACAGPPLVVGSALELDSPGLPVTLVDGDNVFTARAVTRAGAASPCSAPARVRYDRPPRPQPPTSIAIDPGSISQGTHFVIRGLAPGAVRVRAWKNGCAQGAPFADVTPEAFGVDGVALDLDPDTSVTVSLDAVNAEDEVSLCTAVTVTCDRTPPTLVPELRSPSPSPDRSAWIKLSDAAFDTTDLWVFEGAACEGVQLGGCVACFARLWRIDAPREGPLAWSVRARDAAGNESPCVPGDRPFVVDAQAPMPAVELLHEAFDYVAGRVPGSAESVELFEDGGCQGQAMRVDPRALVFSGVPAPAWTVSARARFPDGGVGACSATWTR